ncbi:MAG: hypothetical protein GYB36_07715 [Alphaproteobacteria bacterium]|nr:hypothetical protein [Alphaproteobacteria bacterium]
MSILLMAAASLFIAEAQQDQATGQASSHRRHRPATIARTSDANYPADDLLAGQPNQFPGVDWQAVEVRTVSADAFPGVDWREAGQCRASDGRVGTVHRAAAGDADDRPTEEVAFYYQKVTFVGERGVVGEDGLARAEAGETATTAGRGATNVLRTRTRSTTIQVNADLPPCPR